MATKYSDAIRLRGTRSAYNIQEEDSNEWKNFIPNEQFNEILGKVIRSVNKKYVDDHRSFWLEGTYGTGKSHASAVIKHLLCDSDEDVQEYVEQEFAGDKYAILRNSLYDLRANTRLFPVTMYGMSSIAHREDLSVQIQSHVSRALKAAKIDLVVPTDFDNYISHIEANPQMWDLIISGNSELQSYAPDRKKLTQELRGADTTVLRLVKTALRESRIQIRLEQANLSKWFFEVQDKLAETTEYKGILLLWDEFTDVMASDMGPSLLVDLQELAEATMNMTNNSYFFHIAHPSALDSLKAEERTKTQGRYCFMHYNMEPVSAFKIMSRKFIHEDVKRNEEFFEYHLMTSEYFARMRDVYELYAKSSNNPAETIEDLKSLFPVHPSTANLATYYAREVGSSSRSVFEFLGANDAIREFLDSEEHYANKDMITADYLWDFVLDEFNKKVTKYGVVTERFNSYHLHVAKAGENKLRVFKGILLLNALNNIANSDTVIPSEENIRNMFVGTPIDNEIDDILNWINTESIVQRSPQGIYEIRFSALDTKEIEEIKNNLLSKDYKYTYQILASDDTAKIDVEKSLKGVFRPWKVDFYSEDTNEYHLLNKIETARKSLPAYSIYIAFFVARTTTELSTIKGIIDTVDKEERFRNVVFFVFDSILDKQDFDRFIEYQANAACARKHGFTDQTKSHVDNAKAIISDWMRQIKTGVCTVYVQNYKESISSRQLAACINSAIAPRIYTQGPESLDIIRTKSTSTYWVKQHSKGTADNVLSFSTKEDISDRCNGPAKHMAMLLQDAVDDNLNFKEEAKLGNHPLYQVARFVKSKIDHADKQNEFNLADKFRELTLPPFGLFPSHAGYGMVAFALRPYVDKMFDTTGKPINAQRMLELIHDMFKTWESGSSNSHKVNVKFETKEEGAIAKALINIFQLKKLKGYSDVTSLTDTRWALRLGFCGEIGYPLWALKYSNAMECHPGREKLCKLIDNVVKIYSEVGIKNPSLLAETDSFLTEYKFELTSLIQKEYFVDGFLRFLKTTEMVDLQDDQYDDALLYIKQHLEDGVGLWEENAVRDQLKNWKLSKIVITPPTPPVPPTPSYPPTPNPQPYVEKIQRAKSKVQSIQSLEEAQIVLQKLCDLGYDNILDIILQ
jgi:hypothetical protein